MQDSTDAGMQVPGVRPFARLNAHVLAVEEFEKSQGGKENFMTFHSPEIGGGEFQG